MSRARAVSAASIAGVALFFAACASTLADAPPAEENQTVRRPVSKRADVYLIPIGRTLPGSVGHLASYYRDALRLEVAEAPALPFYTRIYDADRQQLIAEEVTYLMEVWCEGLSTNPSAIFVGITDNDLYIRAKRAPYTFAYPALGRYAVVSSARLAAGPDGGAAAPDLVQTRLRKLVTQLLGALYFDLPLVEDSRSVLSRHIRSLADVDAIDEATLQRDIVEADAARFR